MRERRRDAQAVLTAGQHQGLLASEHPERFTDAPPDPVARHGCSDGLGHSQTDARRTRRGVERHPQRATADVGYDRSPVACAPAR